MTNLDGNSLTWDDNGRLKTGLSNISFEYNWDGKLREATIGDDYVRVKYDPMGNRIWRQSYDYPAPTTTIRKYIVDISAKLPTILCEIDSTGSLTKSYIYTDKSRILAQRNGGQSAAEYFSVTDRLGSVRQLIDDTGSVVRNYTYSPYGQLLEEGSAQGAPTNPFKFTGQALRKIY
jgi:hypothetical protein